ncbi:MAG: nodulation protein NfeD [Actinomycetota bacterium]
MHTRSWITRLLILTACLSFGLVATWSAQAQSASTIVSLRLDGVVDPFIADYLRGAIEEANDDGDPAILLQIDTPGGLGSSMREITQAILGSEVPVICYVAPEGARAASAGAFVLMSCPVATMAPGTNVGAATPVGVSGLTLQRKVTEDAVASIVAMAETYGRNVDVAESFVRDATSISASTALRENVIDRIEPSVDSLLAGVSGTTVTLGDGSATTLPDLTGLELRERSMSPGVGFLHGLLDPDLAFIFFWLGLLLIIIELIVPGHIFSGTVGTILLLTSFAAFGVLPVRLIGVAFLVASVIFFVLEVKAPGLGIWSLAGLGSLVAGGLFLYDGSGGVRVSPWVLLAVAAVVATFFGVVVSKLLSIRHLPPVPHGADALIGQEGVVLGAGLGPHGVVRVASEEWRAVSSSGPLPRDTRIRVMGLDGLVLTVEPLIDEHVPASAPAEGGTTG